MLVLSGERVCCALRVCGLVPAAANTATHRLWLIHSVRPRPRPGAATGPLRSFRSSVCIVLSDQSVGSFPAGIPAADFRNFPFLKFASHLFRCCTFAHSYRNFTKALVRSSRPIDFFVVLCFGAEFRAQYYP